MQVQAIDRLITKLSQASQPLSVEKQHKLAAWLKDYTHRHDEKLINSVFIQMVEEEEQEKML